MERVIGIVEVATRMEGDTRDQKLHNSLGGTPSAAVSFLLDLGGTRAVFKEEEWESQALFTILPTNNYSSQFI